MEESESPNSELKIANSERNKTSVRVKFCTGKVTWGKFSSLDQPCMDMTHN
tara:strand:+ start:773 stop:925 length:153 start_codon:yes stop_codon:yes gene_type:complete